MALFGKADEDLPCLTQFYQVDADDESEMLEFLRRDWIKALEQDPQETRQSIAQQKLITKIPITPLMVQQYQEMHAILQRILNALAENTLTPASDFRRLEEIFDEEDLPLDKAGRKRFALVTPPHDNWATGAIGTTGDVAVANVRVIETFFMMPRHTMRRLLGELFQLFMGNAIDKVQRCEECNNPFIILRSGQKFCSHRCADRVSKRRRRALSD